MRIWVLIGFLLFIYSTSFAQRIVELNDSTKEFVFGGEYLSIYEDESRQLTFEQICDPNFQSNFILNQNSYPYNENLNSAYWIKFKVKNTANYNRNFLLESYAPHTNNWDVYMPNKSGGYDLRRSGLSVNFYEREFVNKNLILSLPFEPINIQTYYVRVLSKNHSSFDYRIKYANYFFYYSVNEYYFLGFFYGIMIIMAVYNLLIYFSIGEKVYIYYVMYVLAGILTSLSDDSIGNQYIWVNFPEINTVLGSHVAPLFLLITFILYSREFLLLQEKHVWYNKIVILVTATYLFYFFIRLLIPMQEFYFGGLYLIPFIVMYYVAIKIFLKGYKPAKYIIVGFGFILVSIVIIKLRSNGTIEGNLFTVYSFNYGLVLEVIVLSFALAERFKFAKKEKENALRDRNKAQFNEIRQYRVNEQLKDKVNRELEQKVEERTIELHTKNHELEDANLKLKEMTEKANLMSMQLDKDNWSLQKKVLESIRDRMVGQEVSYDEFNKLFPDEAACNRYLFELKWDNGFVCYKCSNVESTSEEKVFSKKCNKCGYIESVTAHTLFHAIKFPITKAFYILYIMIYQQDRMTLNSMSDLLQLRKNTCWKFKQKVLASIDLFNKKHKKKNVDAGKSWEQIIFLELPKKK